MKGSQASAAAEALGKIYDAIVETVNEADPAIGAPGGHIYAALASGVGLRLDQYEQIMAALVRAGKVRREGECYFPANTIGGKQ